MLGEGGGAGLEGVRVSVPWFLRAGRVLTIPAAPPPTMTTFFFLPFFSNSSEDMVGKRGAECAAGEGGQCGYRGRDTVGCEDAHASQGQADGNGKVVCHVCHLEM